ncbi:MAG: hypothetical protein DHS20C12_18910 [Pseudohongiella sp.]|nr:MAG: hypothetical protein DHS20C12_18910 [Pseudohongiella sp.]
MPGVNRHLSSGHLPEPMVQGPFSLYSFSRCMLNIDDLFVFVGNSFLGMGEYYDSEESIAKPIYYWRPSSQSGSIGR